jgi:Na+-translocating ferredoxin:NAD+ oxidoreductase RnfD subunit
VRTGSFSKGDSPGGIRRAFGWVEGRFPAARVVWLGLIVLGGYGVWFLENGTGLPSLIAFPIAAMLVDLLFQRMRFDRVRFPDAALATGLFLALLFPPVVPIIAGVAATLFAVAIRHIARLKGRPWFNPAASGVLFGAILFGLGPAWWGSISEPLTLAVGMVLLVRNRRNWRLPVVFLFSYAGLTVLQRAAVASLTASAVSYPVLFLSAIDPSILFFGLFLVPEPRTAPVARPTQSIYAVLIAAGTALGPLAFPTAAPLIALLLVNAAYTAARWRGLGVDATQVRRGASFVPRPSSAPSRKGGWPVSSRVGALIGVIVLLGVLAPLGTNPGGPTVPLLAIGPPSGSSGQVSSGRSTGVCLSDSPSVPAATAASLHKALGPSVILGDNTATGVVTFYDPVNGVTVTETDMYEDFGFAEFNGDDYAISGCVPP